MVQRQRNSFFADFYFSLGLAITASFLFAPKTNGVNGAKANGEEFVVEQKCKYKRLLDNACVEKKGMTNLTPWAVMIENHIEARPLAGIDKASVVFEAIAESTITRFMAVFPGDAEVEKIGPIRSARPYYLDWAAAFDPVYLHVGGSPQALEELRVSGMKDLDQFFWSKYFWRSRNRYAPHNVYSSSDLIKEAIDDRNWDEKAEFDTWIFKKESDLEDRPEEQIVKISFNNYTYDVVWNYDREDNVYTRFQTGRLYKTEDNEDISVENLAIAYSKLSVIDDYGRLFTKTIGEGEAIVFQDGKAIVGVWKKQNSQDRLRFYDSEDNEIEMLEGKFWITIVPDHFPKVQY